MFLDRWTSSYGLAVMIGRFVAMVWGLRLVGFKLWCSGCDGWANMKVCWLFCW